MISQQALYIYEGNERKIALETYTPGDSSLDQPLIIQHLKEEQINLKFEKSIDRNEWRLIKHVHGYIGNIKIKNEIFVLFIDQYKPTGIIPSESKKDSNNVFKIDKVMFVCLNNDKYDEDLDITDNNEEDEEFVMIKEDEFKENNLDPNMLPYDFLKKLFSNQFFYFSNNVDLTRNFQSKYTDKKSSKDFDCNVDLDFLWNANMLNAQFQFLNSSIKDEKIVQHMFRSGLITPIIQGLVHTFIEKKRIYDDIFISATLISRVCWRRAGTRFNTRGLDDDGYVANLVETEMILFNEQHIASYLILRGSIPAFWKQEGNQMLGHKVQINRSIQATQHSCYKHFNWLQKRYNKVMVLNLLSQRMNNPEYQLGKIYEELIIDYDNDNNIFYTAFDFHFVCKNNQFNNAHKLIDQLSNKLNEFNYFLLNRKQNQTILSQSGIPRINCLDCLDRTNIIIGLILNFIFKLKTSQLFEVDKVDYGLLNYFKSQLNQAIILNGDHISKIYAGTGALQSNINQFGKTNLLDKLNDASKSVSRLYQNQFFDKKKQEALDLLLFKNNIKLIYLLNDNMKISRNNINNNNDKDIFIHCGTYNVNGRHPSKDSLLPWLEYNLKEHEDKLPDIYALTFEEIVELTPQQILNADLNRSLIWKQLLIRDLNLLAHKKTNNIDCYSLLCSEQLVGICLFIFIKKELFKSVKLVANTTKKTGLGGIAGNKGAAAIRFELFRKRYCFVAAHFASGQSKFLERNRDFFTIHYELDFFNFGSIEQHDYIFYIGDFNYRINLSYESVKTYIIRNELKMLLAKDQLLSAMKLNWAFPNFKEMEITFLPTYKFDVGTDIYDSSEKRRIPAWTDRVLYKGNNIIPLYYTDAKLYESDHKPVLAGFMISSKEIMDRPIKEKEIKSEPKVETLIDIEDHQLLSTIGLPEPSSDTSQWFLASNFQVLQNNQIKDILKDSKITNPFRNPDLKQYLDSLHYPFCLPPELPQRNQNLLD